MTSNRPVAVIDLGSHSALLLIARWQNGTLTPLKELFKITRLGQGLGESGRLLAENMQRALGILKEFKKEIANFGCTRVFVVGTEALRRAENADAFLQQIKAQFGWEVDVVTPQEEASLSYLGAISVFDNYDQKNFTVIDVGGASTEMTLGKGIHIKETQSFPMGAVALAEAFQFKEKLNRPDLPKIRDFLDEIFDADLLKTLTVNALLVGAGGTITTLAAVKAQMPAYDSQVIDKISLTLDELLLVFEKLNALNLSERRQLKGLEPGREDVIIYGTLIYIHILQRAEKWRIKVSSRGLRYGYLLKKRDAFDRA